MNSNHRLLVGGDKKNGTLTCHSSVIWDVVKKLLIGIKKSLSKNCGTDQINWYDIIIVINLNRKTYFKRFYVFNHTSWYCIVYFLWWLECYYLLYFLECVSNELINCFCCNQKREHFLLADCVLLLIGKYYRVFFVFFSFYWNQWFLGHSNLENLNIKKSLKSFSVNRQKNPEIYFMLSYFEIHNVDAIPRHYT